MYKLFGVTISYFHINPYVRSLLVPFCLFVCPIVNLSSTSFFRMSFVYRSSVYSSSVCPSSVCPSSVCPLYGVMRSWVWKFRHHTKRTDHTRQCFSHGIRTIKQTLLPTQYYLIVSCELRSIEYNKRIVKALKNKMIMWTSCGSLDKNLKSGD